MDLSNLVNTALVTPSGQTGYIGSQGFLFDITGDETVSFDSEITDHYTEDNMSIQDHISLKPVKFTLQGFMGELTDASQNILLNLLTAVQSMSAVGAYTMQFGAQATQVYNAVASAVSQVNTVVNQAQNIYNVISGASTNQTKQQAAYNNFVTLWMDRTLCTVEMPWATLTMMAIENVRVLQRDDNKFVSEFSVTFKQIRTVEPPTTSLIQPGVILNYTAAMTNVAGTVQGQTTTFGGSPVSTDLFSQAYGGLSLR